MTSGKYERNVNHSSGNMSHIKPVADQNKFISKSQPTISRMQRWRPKYSQEG
jgi:hypothetical protein